MLSKQTPAYYQQERPKHKQWVKCQMLKNLISPLYVFLDFVRLCISTRNVTLRFSMKKTKQETNKQKTHICMFSEYKCEVYNANIFFLLLFFLLSMAVIVIVCVSECPLQANSAAL